MFEVAGETIRDVFKAIAGVQDVFEADRTCGVCGGQELVLQHRLVGDYEYFELACRTLDDRERKCNARLAFGQSKKGGGLFPKRKGDDDAWLPNRGWSRYTKPGGAAPGDAEDYGGGY